jgi:hypothetical protein
MTKYAIKLRVRPSAYHGSLLGGAATIAEAIAQTSEEVLVSEWCRAPEGGELLALSLRGDGRDQAFNQALMLVQGFGYSLLGAEVNEIVDNAVEGAVVGFLGCGAIGSTTKSPVIALVAGVAGALAGSKAGSLVETVGARHRYQWLPGSGWVISEIQTRAAGQPEQSTQRAALFPS